MPVEMRDREQAFEAKFVHDEALRFMIGARRDKLFARWAAAKLNLNAEQTDALVQTVIRIPDGRGHDAALLGTIAERLSGQATRETLSAALERCLTEAHAALDGTPYGIAEDRGG
jgi:hypothetical protein